MRGHRGLWRSGFAIAISSFGLLLVSGCGAFRGEIIRGDGIGLAAQVPYTARAGVYAVTEDTRWGQDYANDSGTEQSTIVLPFWHLEISEELEISRSGFSLFPALTDRRVDEEAGEPTSDEYRTLELKFHLIRWGFVVGFDPFWWESTEEDAPATEAVSQSRER